MTVVRELAKYKLDLVGVQEVRWDKERTVRAGEYTFFYGKGQVKHQLGTYGGKERCILVGRPEGRRPVGSPRRRWEDNIKMDLQAVGWATWTGLSWLRIGTGGGHL
jgi:hypothetical protein